MASVVIEMSADEAKLFRAQARLEAKNNRLNNSFGRVGRTAKTAGRQAEQSFGSRASAKIASYAAGFVGVSAAIGGVVSMLRIMKTEADAAVDSFSGLQNAERSLSQIARGADDLRGLRKQADALSTTFGISREESRGLVFSGRSEGFEEAVPRIAEAVGANVIGGDSAATIAGQLPSLFNGEIDGIEAINATMAAAEASRLNVKQITQGLPQAAEGASQLDGVTAAETIGAVSVLASKFKSAQTTGDRLKAISSKFALDDQFSGLGLTESMEKLASLSVEKRRSFLGESVELNGAYNAFISELPKIKERTEVIQKAIDDTGTNRSQLSQRIATNTEVFGPEIDRQKALAAREISREKRFAGEGAQRQTFNNRALSQIDDAKIGMLGKTFGKGFAALNEITGGGGKKGGAEVQNAALLGAVISGDFDAIRRLREATEGQKEAAEEMKAAARSMGKTAEQQRRANNRVTGNTAGARRHANSKSVAVE